MMPTEKINHCPITDCKIELQVRYAEVDQQGALHHSRYAVYFEMGRTELLRINGYDYRSLEESGCVLVIAKLETRFKAPAHYDDSLELMTTLTRADRARLEHQYELKRPGDNKLLAVGSTTLVHVNTQGQLKPMPDFLYPGDDWKPLKGKG
jgi:acyl-CoA thioester hydrolase